MPAPTASTSHNIGRSIGMGVLLSMFFYYAIHVFGKWQLENFRPDPETTASLLLKNECAVIGSSHTLRPGADMSANLDGVTGTKLAASFMNFFDGHIAGMIILGAALSGMIFLLRRPKKKQ